ncbi:MAG: UPF0280 family protein [Sulfitobacter sp.]|nr:UPF0280 family protein [Sulfitobacter sp.]
MSAEPEAYLLDGGRRLHLHQGPIDLIIGVEGAPPERYFARAARRFQTVLSGLAGELPTLRAPVFSDTQVNDPIAQRMIAAVRPHAPIFATPMAAVAGAVADEVLAAMRLDEAVTKAYVNNGGDVAFHLTGSAHMTSLSPAGEITLTPGGTARGLATSGWQGRSHSLGIADAVTVAAPTAAAADVAATLIANAVDLPRHSVIRRTPAHELSPDSDLGARLVTTGVGALSPDDIEMALAAGARRAQQFRDRGLICHAALLLQGRRLLISPQPTLQGDPVHA